MLYLIRHGDTDFNRKGIVMGHKDIPLNCDGILQAFGLSHILADVSFDAIYCSDLKRTRQTAYIIDISHCKGLKTDARLRGYKYGMLEGFSYSKISTPNWIIPQNCPDDFAAESDLDVYTRIKCFFDELFEEYDIENKDIAVVTHGGALRIILYYLENRDHFVQDDYNSHYSNDAYIYHGDYVTYDGTTIDISNTFSRELVRAIRGSRELL